VNEIRYPLTCPLCESRFSYQQYSQAMRTCPHCKVPMGFPFFYRITLSIAALLVAGLTMCMGYQSMGPSWLLLGLPFATVFGLFAKGVILRYVPPKLEAYAGGSTWLKLT
jgi:uncharacterized protein (DUF983 family)